MSASVFSDQLRTVSLLKLCCRGLGIPSCLSTAGGKSLGLIVVATMDLLSIMNYRNGTADTGDRSMANDLAQQTHPKSFAVGVPVRSCVHLPNGQTWLVSVEKYVD